MNDNANVEIIRYCGKSILFAMMICWLKIFEIT